MRTMHTVKWLAAGNAQPAHEKDLHPVSMRGEEQAPLLQRPGAAPDRRNGLRSPIVAPIRERRPPGLRNHRSRHANVCEEPIVEIEKLVVLAPPFYSVQDRERDLPEPAQIWRRAMGCEGCVGRADGAIARHVSPPEWSETTLGSKARRAVVCGPKPIFIMRHIRVQAIPAICRSRPARRGPAAAFTSSLR
ncbi:hypothetical protein ACVWZ4_007168 [Bradyrhizobium sp. USDA 4472]